MNFFSIVKTPTTLTAKVLNSYVTRVRYLYIKSDFSLQYTYCNKIQQNSINLTFTTEQKMNYWIFQVIRWYPHWHRILKLIVCYCSHTFHLEISICWFRAIRVIYCVFAVFKANEADRVWDKGSNYTTMVDIVSQSWRPFWTDLWDLPVSLTKLLASKKQNLRSWNYS